MRTEDQTVFISIDQMLERIESLKRALAEAEKREAVKDKAIQWVSGELLVIGFSLNESTRFEQLSNRLLTALSTTKTDKVLVSVQKLQDTYQALNDACGDLEFGTDSYISVASVREWLFDIVEGGR